MFWTIGHLARGRLSVLFPYDLHCLFLTLLRVILKLQLVSGESQGQDRDVIFLSKELRGFGYLLGRHSSEARKPFEAVELSCLRACLWNAV